jgi:hypothetical protein
VPRARPRVRGRPRTGAPEWPQSRRLRRSSRPPWRHRLRNRSRPGRSSRSRRHSGPPRQSRRPPRPRSPKTRSRGAPGRLRARPARRGQHGRGQHRPGQYRPGPLSRAPARRRPGRGRLRLGPVAPADGRVRQRRLASGRVRGQAHGRVTTRSAPRRPAWARRHGRRLVRPRRPGPARRTRPGPAVRDQPARGLAPAACRPGQSAAVRLRADPVARAAAATEDQAPEPARAPVAGAGALAAVPVAVAVVPAAVPAGPVAVPAAAPGRGWPQRVPAAAGGAELARLARLAGPAAGPRVAGSRGSSAARNSTTCKRRRSAVCRSRAATGR